MTLLLHVRTSHGGSLSQGKRITTRSKSFFALLFLGRNSGDSTALQLSVLPFVHCFARRHLQEPHLSPMHSAPPRSPAERTATDSFIQSGGGRMKNKAHSTDFHLKMRINSNMYQVCLSTSEAATCGERCHRLTLKRAYNQARLP